MSHRAVRDFSWHSFRFRASRSRGQSTSGREGVSTSRRGFATLCLGSLAATAGCLGPFGDDDTDDGNGNGNGTIDGFAVVPADVDGVLSVENRMIEDESGVVVMEGVMETGTELVDEEGLIAEYRDLVVELGESEVDHDESVLFYRNEETEYAALVVETNDDQEAALEHVEDRFDEVEETTDGDVDVFAGERDGVTEWLAPLGETSLIVGTEQAVSDSLDVYRGDAEPFDGELRSAYDQASDGEMKATMTLEDDELDSIVSEISPELAGALGLLPDPEILTVTYQTVDEGVLFDMQLTMESENEAEQFQGVVDVFLDDGDGLPIGDDALDDELLDDLSAERTDTHVTLTLSTTASELASYFE